MSLCVVKEVGEFETVDEQFKVCNLGCQVPYPFSQESFDEQAVFCAKWLKHAPAI